MNRFAIISAGFFFFFLETDKLILKCKTKELRLAEIIFKKNKCGELTLLNFEFYYKQSVMDPQISGTEQSPEKPLTHIVS